MLLITSKTERERRLRLTVGLSYIYIYISELANGTESPFISVRIDKEERV